MIFIQYFLFVLRHNTFKQSQHYNKINTWGLHFEKNICKIIVETKMRVVGALVNTGLDLLHASASSQLWTHPWTYLKIEKKVFFLYLFNFDLSEKLFFFRQTCQKSRHCVLILQIETKKWGKTWDIHFWTPHGILMLKKYLKSWSTGAT